MPKTATTLMLAVSITVTFALPAVAQYEPGPSITVTPPEVEPGDNVKVRLDNCEPAPGQIDILIDGVFVGTARTNPDGHAVDTFIVPLEAAGDVSVEADCANGSVASTITVITPDLAFQPPAGGGNTLPRTGNESGVLVQLGIALLGMGAVLWVIGEARRREPYVPMHAMTGDMDA